MAVTGVIRKIKKGSYTIYESNINGNVCGTISKQFTLFRPKNEVDCKGWRVESDFLGWDYDVYEGCSLIIHISKEPFHWGDTYVIDFVNPADEILGLMLVITIDVANCTEE